VTYFKTPEMHNLDEHYGDLQNVIIGERKNNNKG
jgi:hypothetical protein